MTLGGIPPRRVPCNSFGRSMSSISIRRGFQGFPEKRHQLQLGICGATRQCEKYSGHSGAKRSRTLSASPRPSMLSQRATDARVNRKLKKNCKHQNMCACFHFGCIMWVFGQLTQGQRRNLRHTLRPKLTGQWECYLIPRHLARDVPHSRQAMFL